MVACTSCNGRACVRANSCDHKGHRPVAVLSAGQHCCGTTKPDSHAAWTAAVHSLPCSRNSYDSNSWRTETGDVALGHITNYAQNMDGTVWDLERLQQHMGEFTKGAWGSVHRKGSRRKHG